MLLAINYPSWIHPEIFPGVPVLGLIRWYGLMYIFAFAAAYLVLSRLRKEGTFDTPGFSAGEDDVLSFFTTGIIFLLLGARIFSTLVYDTSGLYRQKPWLIFWPFDIATGRFTGLAGMSYHGGYIGCLLGLVFWCFRKKQPPFKWIDAIVITIAAGYTFGRIGNFLNGELYGRVTTVPWGMIFPGASKFSLSLDWVRETAEQARLVFPEGTRLINLPRHPSQLYEAFFEGLVLFLLLWCIRKHKPFDGFLAAVYTAGYAIFRFFIEYFREPDTDLGYRFA
ncbi:MAG: prolipoprotein diacylglyceryl transferase, partial [Treponema sp.]|nr:prolipoprotein diacylglyceryl transferase [Treponema sp.]